MPPRVSFLLSTPSAEREAALQGLLIGSIVIAGLYFGREVLLPLALAILLSFVLTPPLLLLRRIKLPRVVAVGIVVGAAFAIILALGWAISREVTQLAVDLPSYRLSLSEKIKSFRESTATLASAGEGGRSPLRVTEGIRQLRGRGSCQAYGRRRGRAPRRPAAPGGDQRARAVRTRAL